GRGLRACISGNARRIEKVGEAGFRKAERIRGFGAHRSLTERSRVHTQIPSRRPFHRDVARTREPCFCVPAALADYVRAQRGRGNRALTLGGELDLLRVPSRQSWLDAIVKNHKGREGRRSKNQNACLQHQPSRNVGKSWSCV